MFDEEYIKGRPLNGSSFVFTLDQPTRERVFEKVFGENGNRFSEILSQSADAVMDSVSLDDNSHLDNLQQLENYCRFLEGRFKGFYDICNERFSQKVLFDDISDNMSLDGAEEEISMPGSPKNSTTTGTLVENFGHQK